MRVSAYAAPSATEALGAWSLERRALGAHDVRLDITHCGVCHSDLHTARNEWGGTKYPCVPGHEIVGVVAEIGASVTGFTLGQRGAIGCIVDSCRACEPCRECEEQFCEKGMTGTYNGAEKLTGGITYGGYSKSIVCDARYVLRVPDALDSARTAPLLCAGITTYSPLKHWKVGPGQKVGIVGLGGLGHMGVKFARALGAHVVVFTTSPSKIDDATALGAHQVIVSTDREAMRAHRGSFHFILNTASGAQNLDHYVACLRRNGVMTLVGAPATPHQGPSTFMLLSNRRSVAGSPIGGIAETQEMLDFCAAHGIGSDVEVIAMADINDAYERMLRGDVRYRFVIDLETLA